MITKTAFSEAVFFCAFMMFKHCLPQLNYHIFKTRCFCL